MESRDLFDRRPFKDETDEERLYFETIGRLSVHFAPIESFLDVTCLTIFHCMNGNEGTKRIPTSVGAKLDFIRKHEGSLAQTDWDLATLRSLLDRIQEAARERNNVLHSVVLEAHHNLQISAVGIVHGKLLHQHEDRSFSVQRLENLTDEFCELSQQAKQLLMICMRVVVEHGREQGWVLVRSGDDDIE